MTTSQFRRTMAPDTQPPQRIVSLLGASTETIYRLGLGHLLVGRSNECDWPPKVLNLACVSAPRLDVDASSSATIDATVRERAAEGQPMYKLDDNVISVLQPDLIIAQDHCRVCAITPADLARADAKAQSSATCSNIKQLVVRPSTLEDCMDNITTIAETLGVSERGLMLRQTLEERLDRVRAVVSDARPKDATSVPRVALLEWCEPIMGCGYWLPELVELAGGYPLHCPPSGTGGATSSISYETLMDSRPDVVIFALCGFGLTRAASELLNSWGEEWLKELQERVPVYIVDGNYLVNRSGPRLVESAEAIAEAIHDKLRGHFGHYGTEFLCSLDDAIDMARRGLHTGSKKARPPPAIDGSAEEKNVANLDQEKTNLPVQTPTEVVKEQLRLLRTGDVAHAFVLNRDANQVRWCGPERFEAVLGGHDDFRRLLSEEAEIGDSEERDGIATVPVTLPAGENSKRVNLIWTMVIDKSDDGKTSSWRTEKVGSRVLITL